MSTNHLERLDALAEHWVAVVVAGFLWVGGEFVAAAGVLVMYS